MNYRLKLKRLLKFIPKFRPITTILILPILLFYAYFIEPNWIEINSIHLTLPHLAQEFNNYRLVQISDIHISKWMTQKRLNYVFQLVNAQKPDLIVLTGDFVSRRQQRFIPLLQNTIGQLNAPDGKIAVLGNHDYWSDPEGVDQALTTNQIQNLRNAVTQISRGKAKLYIAGVDDVMVGQHRLDRVINNLPHDGAAILLAHEPDFADTSVKTHKFDLQLSGHSHAGQLRIPFVTPPVLPILGRKYYAGLYDLGEMKLYTNRGIGMTGFHLRFNARPEITVFTLDAGSRELGVGD
ncbi:metallophosphoesterase [Calothrix sp. NIES-3974]|uniref:metallophosphoesterase n=1 Tax=Calothrix sp. NIES-3974 TaxID=2005462 RepID=UPI001E3012C3|nr:metallophosphoesterase [Calothrix sp. NIES-3974]